jgi:4-hydroxybenzoate polyprenyltransferase
MKSMLAPSAEPSPAEPTPPPPSLLRALFRAMRPKQWAKNGLVFLPLVFTANQYWSPRSSHDVVHVVALTLAAFALFCLLSSVVYLVNDLADIDKDRLHPVKRRRPLAAGHLSPGIARAAAVVILLGALPTAFLLRASFGLVSLLYFAVTVLYTFVLKRVLLLDVFALAAGFLLRTVAGAEVIGVPVSPWLYVCTTLGSLFLGFAKRRHELLLLQGDAGKHRAILAEYTPQLLDQILAVITSSTVMAYSLYTFTAENLPKNHAMMLTIPFVLFGIFRYLYLIYVKNNGGSPEDALLQDRPLLAAVVLWLASAAGVLIAFRR